MKSAFKKYYDKLVMIGLLKSAVFSLIVGFGVNFVAAFITCFIDMSIGAVLGISLGSGAFAAVVAFPILYFAKFKPTVKKMAEILDKQGLEERMITMVELENDESYIAMIQRENALRSLEKVSPKSLKVALPVLIILILAASVTLGVSMTTVTSLVAADVISVSAKSDTGSDDPSQGDEEEPKDEELVSILYEAGEHGSIEGQLFQQIPKGGEASAVVAVPDEGYVFCYWSDGTFTAERRDRNVTVSFSVRAVFEEEPKIGEGEGGGDEGGEGGSGDSGGEGGGQGGQGGNQGGQGDGEGEGDGDGEGGKGQGSGGGGAGASGVKDNNTVIDGTQDYHDAIDYNAMKEQIESDESLTQEEKDMYLLYLKMLMGENKEE